MAQFFTDVTTKLAGENITNCIFQFLFYFFIFSCRHMLETCQPIESAQIEVMFFVTHTNQKMSPSQTRLGTSSATEMRKMVMQM